jgi:heme exporter protein CcmD
MIWTDWLSFWEMGGHAAYVWSSVAAALVALAVESAALAVREREQRRQVAPRQDRSRQELSEGCTQ